MLTFAKTYERIAREFISDPSYGVNFACRNLKMRLERSLEEYIAMDGHGVSMFSHPHHRVTPIRFALAELCWILAGRNDIQSIASYNKSMEHYADDKLIYSGAYGARLRNQLPVLIERLKSDIYTRQACATIFTEGDCVDTSKTHIPCNVFLQFLCRPPFLDLFVTSRSSDFVTGFSIDTIHWQALLIMMANELKLEGISVLPNILHYNITSLHVYENDWDLVTGWDVRGSFMRSEHFIPFTIPLSIAIGRSERMFEGDLSTKQLGYILDIGDHMHSTFDHLDLMFKLHRNRVVR